MKQIKSVLLVIARNKQAIYVNNSLLFSGDHGSAMNNITSLLFNHSNCNIKQVFLSMEINEFTKQIRDFDKNKEFVIKKSL